MLGLPQINQVAITWRRHHDYHVVVVGLHLKWLPYHGSIELIQFLHFFGLKVQQENEIAIAEHDLTNFLLFHFEEVKICANASFSEDI